MTPMGTKVTKSKGPLFVKYFGPVLHALRELGGSGSPSEVADKVAELLDVPAKTHWIAERLSMGHPGSVSRLVVTASKDAKHESELKKLIKLLKCVT